MALEKKCFSSLGMIRKAIEKRGGIINDESPAFSTPSCEECTTGSWVLANVYNGNGLKTEFYSCNCDGRRDKEAAVFSLRVEYRSKVIK